METTKHDQNLKRKLQKEYSLNKYKKISKMENKTKQNNEILAIYVGKLNERQEKKKNLKPVMDIVKSIESINRDGICS